MIGKYFLGPLYTYLHFETASNYNKTGVIQKSLNGFSFEQIVVYNLEIKYMQLTLITRNIYTYLTFHSDPFFRYIGELKMALEGMLGVTHSHIFIFAIIFALAKFN